MRIRLRQSAGKPAAGTSPALDDTGPVRLITCAVRLHLDGACLSTGRRHPMPMGEDMPRSMRAALLCAVLLALTVQPAAAYIGPGAGITMLGALWGVIVAIALAVGAILFWPIRILFRRRRRPASAAPASAQVSPSEPS
jgi:hypothetical protein